jgi:hypothetical protein
MKNISESEVEAARQIVGANLAKIGAVNEWVVFVNGEPELSIYGDGDDFSEQYEDFFLAKNLEAQRSDTPLPEFDVLHAISARPALVRTEEPEPVAVE